MDRKQVAAGLCALFLALAPGCSPMPVNVEELLDAPRLSEEQYQVDQALREQIGQDVKLKYPQSGSYRSAFTFHDIDRDGENEAIVLHSYQSGGNAQITIMDLREGQWRVECTYPGLSPDIDFIRFEPLMAGGGETMIIGWRPEGGQKILAAYRYEDRYFTMLGSEDYAQLAVADYNGDGKSELLVVASESSARFSLLYMGEVDGMLDVLDRVPLEREITSFQSQVSGYLFPDTFGVALDGSTDSGELCTILVHVAEEKLVLPLSAGDGMLFSATRRPGGDQGVYCRDVNEDGILDIPTHWTPPGYDRLDEDSRLSFVSYVDLEGSGFSTVLRAFEDPAAGFRLVMPERWFTGTEQVTAARRAGSGEITFFLYTNGDIGDRSRELLRLQVVDLQSPPRQFAAENYFQVGKRGSFEYYASLPSGRGEEEYALTQEEVLELFQLL